MWNETNPTSLYLGTTWELISSGKYIQTGNNALQSGGSNSITIAKINLPNIKLNTTSATASIEPHFHDSSLGMNSYSGIYGDYTSSVKARAWEAAKLDASRHFKTSTDGGGVTGTFSLQTEALGNGASISIQPSYITLKFWKRLS